MGSRIQVLKLNLKFFNQFKFINFNKTRNFSCIFIIKIKKKRVLEESFST